MTPRQQRLKQRNDRIRARFDQLSLKRPQWTFKALLAELNKEYLGFSTRTLSGILNFEQEKRWEKSKNKQNV